VDVTRAAAVAPRIALIHALAHSVAPINDALAAAWPQAQRMNLLDDSLSADLARTGALDAAMAQRFIALGDYAVATGAQALLFTCSAFGPCIEAVARRHANLPVLKPNEAMVDDAVAMVQRSGGKVGLVASFAPTLASLPAEFPPGTPLLTALAEGALAALDAGDGAAHDALWADAAARLAQQGCRVIALTQFSGARAAAAVSARTGLPVLTTPGSAIERLRQRLGAWSAPA
jgi:hypothetical protein